MKIVLTGFGLVEAQCRSTQLLQFILAPLIINHMQISTGAWAINTKTPLALPNSLIQDPIKIQSSPIILLISMNSSDSWPERANNTDNCNGKRKKVSEPQSVVNPKQ